MMIFFFQSSVYCLLRPTTLDQAGTCINKEVVVGSSRPTGALALGEATDPVVLSTNPEVVAS